MKKPTITEITEYMNEINMDPDQPEAFYDYFESNGWRVGRNPMKSWKAAIRTWGRNANKWAKNENYQSSNFAERQHKQADRARAELAASGDCKNVLEFIRAVGGPIPK